MLFFFSGRRSLPLVPSGLLTLEPIQPRLFNLHLSIPEIGELPLLVLITNPTRVLTCIKGVVWAKGFVSSYPQFRCLLSNYLSSPSYLIISRSSSIAILRSIWNYACYAVSEGFLLRIFSKGNSPRQRQQGKGKKLTTVVLEKLDWVCPRSSSPCFFAYCNVVVKSERQRISLRNLILFDHSRSTLIAILKSIWNHA